MTFEQLFQWPLGQDSMPGEKSVGSHFSEAPCD